MQAAAQAPSQMIQPVSAAPTQNQQQQKPVETKKNAMMDGKFSNLFDISSDALRQQAPKKQENNLLLTAQSNSTEVQMGLNQPSFGMQQ